MTTTPTGFKAVQYDDTATLHDMLNPGADVLNYHQFVSQNAHPGNVNSVAEVGANLARGEKFRDAVKTTAKHQAVIRDQSIAYRRATQGTAPA